MHCQLFYHKAVMSKQIPCTHPVRREMVAIITIGYKTNKWSFINYRFVNLNIPCVILLVSNYTKIVPIDKQTKAYLVL